MVLRERIGVLVLVALGAVVASGLGDVRAVSEARRDPLVLGRQSANPNNPRDPVGTAMITGQVVDDATGQPVAGVRVTRWLAPTGAAFQHEVISDAQGRFLFRDVGAGSYKVVAEIPGYGPGGYGKRRS